MCEMPATGFSALACVMESATLVSECCACEQNVELLGGTAECAFRLLNKRMSCDLE